MTTCADLIARTRSRLYSGSNDTRNKLLAAYTAGSGTMQFQYPLVGLQVGTRLSVGLNTFFVWDVDGDGKTATVSGGEEGTTDANAAAGTAVLVRAQYTDFEIFTALNDDLADLDGKGLYAVGVLEVPASSSRFAYDLTGITSVQSIIEVQYRDPGPYNQWHRMEKAQWRWETGQNTTDFPSGNSLTLTDMPVPGQPIRVTYSKSFTQFAALNDTTVSVGLPTTCVDLPPLGAAINLIASKEVRRNQIDAQPDARRAAEVGPGAVSQSPRNLMMLRQQRIETEYGRLLNLYGETIR